MTRELQSSILRTRNKAVVKIPRRENMLTFGLSFKSWQVGIQIFKIDRKWWHGLQYSVWMHCTHQQSAKWNDSPSYYLFSDLLGRSRQNVPQNVHHSHLPGSPNNDRKPPNSNLLPSYIGNTCGCFVQMSLQCPRKNWVRLSEGEYKRHGRIIFFLFVNYLL